MPVSELEKNLIQRVCVGDIVTRSAAHFPGRVALKDGDQVLTYRELNERVNRCGHALLRRGLEHQDRVALLLPNSWEFLVTYFACAKAGLVAVPLNPRLQGADIAYCLRDSGAKVLVAHALFAPLLSPVLEGLDGLEHVVWCRTDIFASEDEKPADRFETLLAAGDPSEVERIVRDRDLVQLLYTSGTTAAPKGVMTSHVAVTITAFSSALQAKLDHRDVSLAVLPLFHCAQLNGITIPALLTGATTILTPLFDPQQVIGILEKENVTVTAMLPMMYQAILAEVSGRNLTFPSVRTAIYAMAPMPESRIAAIRNVFPNADVVLGSGQTELTPPTTFQRPEHQFTKAASWGPATTGVQIAIMDDDGNLLPPNETGEIVYRSPQAMEGYLNQPEKTEEIFRHGWLHSGDVGWMDEEGVVWFTDRKKDMIKTGGENVPSIEVERRLMEHPAVQEAAVVGLPHDRWGEAVTGVVMRKPGQEVTADELIAFCRETLAGFKVPKGIHFVDDFPRTGTGKIQKHLLREQLKDFYAKQIGEAEG